MKSFEKYLLDNLNLKVPHGTISGSWFADNGIPMVVRCCCCDMSMASPSAWLDDDGYTYCSDCADVKENYYEKN